MSTYVHRTRAFRLVTRDARLRQYDALQLIRHWRQVEGYPGLRVAVARIARSIRRGDAL